MRHRSPPPGTATRIPPAVGILRWPQDGAPRARLAALGLPRLLLIDPDTREVPELGRDEDWARLPIAEPDLVARVTALRDRSGTVVMDGPLLRTEGGSVTLSPAETAVASPLLLTPTTVVAREALERGLRLVVEVTPRTLDDVVYRLRRRLRTVGLDVVAARGRGFSIQARLDWPAADGVTLV
jgi:hypothetical protein